MRTTVDLDEDILRISKDLAEERSQSLGRILSDLARRGLEPQRAASEKAPAKSHGVPVLPRLPGAKPVTSKVVRELLELEN